MRKFLAHSTTGFVLLTAAAFAQSSQPDGKDGVAMNIIAGFLGDTAKTVEKNYLHLSPDYRRQAVDR